MVGEPKSTNKIIHEGRDGKDHKLYKTTHRYHELYNLRGYKEKQHWELKHPESRTMLSMY
jgi:hypothetical protein